VTQVVGLDRDGQSVSARFVFASKAHRVAFRATSRVDAGGDSLLALLLQPAMTVGGPLDLGQEPVSAKLLSEAEQIQAIWSTWRPKLHHVQVVAPALEDGPAPGPGVACFFSGGVDSFYTLLRHRDEITHLLLIHGFDLELEDRDLRERVSEMVTAVAADLGKHVVEVETDVRMFSDRHVGWGDYHGAAFASVALLFQAQFRRVFLAASHTYNDLFPWGSHPLVDPLWSTERTELVHDAAEVTRSEKVAALAQSQLALDWLRVCWRNPGGAYNCGRCEKCLRTMIALKIAGALERAKTFPELDLDAVAHMRCAEINEQMFARDSVAAVERRGADPELAEALRMTPRRERRQAISAARRTGSEVAAV